MHRLFTLSENSNVANSLSLARSALWSFAACVEVSAAFRILILRCMQSAWKKCISIISQFPTEAHAHGSGCHVADNNIEHRNLRFTGWVLALQFRSRCIWALELVGILTKLWVTFSLISGFASWAGLNSRLRILWQRKVNFFQINSLEDKALWPSESSEERILVQKVWGSEA